MAPPRRTSALAPLVVFGVVVALVGVGAGQGLWLPNVHNGLLALGFGLVGTVVLLGRPRHREGTLLLVVGVLEAVMFCGRQIGHAHGGGWGEGWWAWLGVWPLALTLVAVTWCVLCFPEGRFLSRGWRWLGLAALGVGGVLSAASALWPVEYAATGTTAAHPLSLPGAATAAAVWDAVAHPAYALLQVSWVVAVAARWRASDPVARRQLAVLLAAVALSAVALLAGLLVAGSPRAGVLAATTVPLAAGWALERLSLARVIEEGAGAGRLEGLTPRENDVLDLMAQGLSNAAIAARLHLSVKTVEPVVSSVFTKLGLPSDADSNRRVLAVVEYLRR